MVFGVDLDKKKINKGKKEPLFNTEEMLPISEIRGDTFILKDGGMRAILKVEGINLDLRNYDEQQIVLEQYKRFLNGLQFPVQILLRNTYLDLSDYLGYVEKKINNISNDVFKEYGQQYQAFLQDIDSQRGLIFVKEFYIVVPYYVGDKDSEQIRKPWRAKMLDVLNMKDGVEKIVSRYRIFLKNEKFLTTRANVVVDGLNSIGLPTKRLKMGDIVSLLFRSYNPTLHASQAPYVED